MLVPTALLLSTLVSAPKGDCASDAKNLLAKADCGFATGIKGWEAGTSGEKVTHEAREGDPTPGALRAVSSGQGTLEAQSPCLAAAPKTSYAFGARFRLAEGQVYVCGPQVHHYSDAACQDASGPLAAMADLATSSWQAFDPARRPEAGAKQGIAATTAETRAIRLKLVCSGPAPFTVLFDDVFVSPR
jgi:hypothetical protein